MMIHGSNAVNGNRWWTFRGIVVGSAIQLHYMRDNNNDDFNTKKLAALQSVREHQATLLHWDVKKNECDKEKNYFLKVLGVDGWKSLIMEFLNHVRASFPFACPTNFGPIKHIVVRGNTLSVLCNLVQQYVIDTLEQAVLLAVHRTSESNEYPILKKVDILLALGLAKHMVPGRQHFNWTPRNKSGTV